MTITHEIIREFILETFLLNDNDNLDNDTSFLENGILDPTDILDLVTFIEETFRIEIDGEEIIPENLDSINSILGFLDKKTGNRKVSFV